MSTEIGQIQGKLKGNPEPSDRLVQKNPAAIKARIVATCLSSNKGQLASKSRFFQRIGRW
jgi:hypothetical protein